MKGQVVCRVLLVAHNTLEGRSLTGTLVASGYVVRRATDGLDAIGKLREGPPDLIICHLALPRMSGNEFLSVVRRRFPQIPVIAIRNETYSPEGADGTEADACFQEHGFSHAELLETMSDLLRNGPPRSPLPKAENQPVPGNRDGDGHYLVICPHCLRPNNVPRSPYFAERENTTVCIHCRSMVHFLADDGDSSAGSAA